MTREEMIEGHDNEHIFIGTLSALCNRLQASGDSFYDEITFKQFFLLICLSLFREYPPTINELSDVMGSSHQNVKQIVIKLEKNGFLKTYVDPLDRRKIRIIQTEKIAELDGKYNAKEKEFFLNMFRDIQADELEITLKTITTIEYNLRNMKGDYNENHRSI